MRHPGISMRLAALLAAVALAGAAAACGGGDDDGATTATTGGAAATQATQATQAAEPESTGGAAAGEGVATQVSAGEQVFSESCAACHGEQGEGGTGPAVIGDGTLTSYDNAAELLEYVSQNMPASDPGSLTERQYVDVVAYLLDAHDALGDEALSRQNAADVSLAGGS